MKMVCPQAILGMGLISSLVLISLVQTDRVWSDELGAGVEVDAIDRQRWRPIGVFESQVVETIPDDFVPVRYEDFLRRAAAGSGRGDGDVDSSGTPDVRVGDAAEPVVEIVARMELRSPIASDSGGLISNPTQRLHLSMRLDFAHPGGSVAIDLGRPNLAVESATFETVSNDLASDAGDAGASDADTGDADGTDEDDDADDGTDADAEDRDDAGSPPATADLRLHSDGDRRWEIIGRAPRGAYRLRLETVAIADVAADRWGCSIELPTVDRGTMQIPGTVGWTTLMDGRAIDGDAVSIGGRGTIRLESRRDGHRDVVVHRSKFGHRLEDRRWVWRQTFEVSGVRSHQTLRLLPVDRLSPALPPLEVDRIEVRVDGQRVQYEISQSMVRFAIPEHRSRLAQEDRDSNRQIQIDAEVPARFETGPTITLPVFRLVDSINTQRGTSWLIDVGADRRITSIDGVASRDRSANQPGVHSNGDDSNGDDSSFENLLPESWIWRDADALGDRRGSIIQLDGVTTRASTVRVAVVDRSAIQQRHLWMRIGGTPDRVNATIRYVVRSNRRTTDPITIGTRNGWIIERIESINGDSIDWERNDTSARVRLWPRDDHWRAGSESNRRFELTIDIIASRNRDTPGRSTIRFDRPIDDPVHDPPIGDVNRSPLVFTGSAIPPVRVATVLTPPTGQSFAIEDVTQLGIRPRPISEEPPVVEPVRVNAAFPEAAFSAAAFPDAELWDATLWDAALWDATLWDATLWDPAAIAFLRPGRTAAIALGDFPVHAPMRGEMTYALIEPDIRQDARVSAHYGESRGMGFETIAVQIESGRPVNEVVLGGIASDEPAFWLMPSSALADANFEPALAMAIANRFADQPGNTGLIPGNARQRPGKAYRRPGDDWVRIERERVTRRTDLGEDRFVIDTFPMDINGWTLVCRGPAKVRSVKLRSAKSRSAKSSLSGVSSAGVSTRVSLPYVPTASLPTSESSAEIRQNYATFDASLEIWRHGVDVLRMPPIQTDGGRSASAVAYGSDDRTWVALRSAKRSVTEPLIESFSVHYFMDIDGLDYADVRIRPAVDAASASPGQSADATGGPIVLTVPPGWQLKPGLINADPTGPIRVGERNHRFVWYSPRQPIKVRFERWVPRHTVHRWVRAEPFDLNGFVVHQRQSISARGSGWLPRIWFGGYAGGLADRWAVAVEPDSRLLVISRPMTLAAGWLVAVIGFAIGWMVNSRHQILLVVWGLAIGLALAFSDWFVPLSTFVLTPVLAGVLLNRTSTTRHRSNQSPSNDDSKKPSASDPALTPSSGSASSVTKRSVLTTIGKSIAIGTGVAIGVAGGGTTEAQVREPESDAVPPSVRGEPRTTVLIPMDANGRRSGSVVYVPADRWRSASATGDAEIESSSRRPGGAVHVTSAQHRIIVDRADGFTLRSVYTVKCDRDAVAQLDGRTWRLHNVVGIEGPTPTVQSSGQNEVQLRFDVDAKRFAIEFRLDGAKTDDVTTYSAPVLPSVFATASITSFQTATELTSIESVGGSVDVRGMNTAVMGGPRLSANLDGAIDDGRMDAALRDDIIGGRDVEISGSLDRVYLGAVTRLNFGARRLVDDASTDTTVRPRRLFVVNVFADRVVTFCDWMPPPSTTTVRVSLPRDVVPVLVDSAWVEVLPDDIETDAVITETTVRRTRTYQRVRNDASSFGGKLRWMFTQTYDATRSESLEIPDVQPSDGRPIASTTVALVTPTTQIARLRSIDRVEPVELDAFFDDRQFDDSFIEDRGSVRRVVRVRDRLPAVVIEPIDQTPTVQWMHRWNFDSVRPELITVGNIRSNVAIGTLRMKSFADNPSLRRSQFWVDGRWVPVTGNATIQRGTLGFITTSTAKLIVRTPILPVTNQTRTDQSDNSRNIAAVPSDGIEPGDGIGRGVALSPVSTSPVSTSPVSTSPVEIPPVAIPLVGVRTVQSNHVVVGDPSIIDVENEFQPGPNQASDDAANQPVWRSSDVQAIRDNPQAGRSATADQFGNVALATLTLRDHFDAAVVGRVTSRPDERSFVTAEAVKVDDDWIYRVVAGGPLPSIRRVVVATSALSSLVWSRRPETLYQRPLPDGQSTLLSWVAAQPSDMFEGAWQRRGGTFIAPLIDVPDQPRALMRVVLPDESMLPSTNKPMRLDWNLAGLQPIGTAPPPRMIDASPATTAHGGDRTLYRIITPRYKVSLASARSRPVQPMIHSQSRHRIPRPTSWLICETIWVQPGDRQELQFRVDGQIEKIKIRVENREIAHRQDGEKLFVPILGGRLPRRIDVMYTLNPIHNGQSPPLCQWDDLGVVTSYTTDYQMTDHGVTDHGMTHGVLRSIGAGNESDGGSTTTDGLVRSVDTYAARINLAAALVQAIELAADDDTVPPIMVDVWAKQRMADYVELRRDVDAVSETTDSPMTPLRKRRSSLDARLAEVLSEMTNADRDDLWEAITASDSIERSTINAFGVDGDRVVAMAVTSGTAMDPVVFAGRSTDTFSRAFRQTCYFALTLMAATLAYLSLRRWVRISERWLLHPATLLAALGLASTAFLPTQICAAVSAVALLALLGELGISLRDLPRFVRRVPSRLNRTAADR